MSKVNPTFRVAGVTKENDQGKDIQNLLKRLAGGYKKNEYIESWNGNTKKEMLEYGYEGFEFEDESISNIIRLEREPDNPHDPNAIKVYIKDVNDGEHHIGYIKREETEEVVALTHDKDIVGIDVEFTGGKRRTIEYDSVEDKEYFEEDEVTRGLKLIFKYKRVTQPTIPASEPTKKDIAATKKNLGGSLEHTGKAMSGCGCLLTVFITIPVILIIIWLLL
ncbi:HIRAN domain-containing protein [Sporosarcina luteola]|uniref:HIRAN domain-containing protein n=1 Tax=Sporosarcina luteola TaxID=582850 RepID=UPI0020415EAB|nr:HIRAN domain-containing protein [Sporosarcina luteola]MCM3711952.1 HIRAN domain-containing protein [Sporosarcina luteola]